MADDRDDWGPEIAAWLAGTAACSRCGEPLARSRAVIGAWLTDGEVAPPRVRGLCPDGKPHTAGEASDGGR